MTRHPSKRADTSNPTAIAIVVAAGTGSRLEAPTPKQFIDIAGRPLLAHTLAPFQASGSIERLIVVLPSRGFDAYAGLTERWLDARKPVEMVPGGEERQDSVWQGLRRVPSSFDGLVAIHDGARPLVSEALIGAVVEAARRYGAALAALPVHETLKEVGPDEMVRFTVDRRELFRAQTPQCFRYGLLREAFRRAYAEGFHATDESALVERLDVPVKVIEGSEKNLKITTAEDLALARYYLGSGA